MEVKELKIGDYVYANPSTVDDGDGKRTIQVTAIFNDGVMDDNINFIDVVTLSPIPITKEFLLKNYPKIVHGAYSCYNYSYYENNKSSILIASHQQDTIFWAWYEDEEKKLIEVKYIHQLQHLMWAIGEDDSWIEL